MCLITMLQVLPSVIFWIATVYCSRAFAAVCPYSQQNSGVPWQCVVGRCTSSLPFSR